MHLFAPRLSGRAGQTSHIGDNICVNNGQIVCLLWIGHSCASARTCTRKRARPDGKSTVGSTGGGQSSGQSSDCIE